MSKVLLPERIEEALAVVRRVGTVDALVAGALLRQELLTLTETVQGFESVVRNYEEREAGGYWTHGPISEERGHNPEHYG